MEKPEGVSSNVEVTLDLRVKFKMRSEKGEDCEAKAIDQVLPELQAFFNSIEIGRFLSRPLLAS